MTELLLEGLRVVIVKVKRHWSKCLRPASFPKGNLITISIFANDQVILNWQYKEKTHINERGGSERLKVLNHFFTILFLLSDMMRR